MDDVAQEIKARLSIEDLVGQYVQLKKIGRSLKGLCPFHSEKTPSFIVSPDKGIAYCFGCNRGGDIFRFLQEIEGVDFVDALKILAERAGVKLEHFEVQKSVSKDEKDQLLAVHKAAGEFYQQRLWQTKDGEKVLEYLQKRGLTENTIRLFCLGFAPDSYEETYTFLMKKGFQKKVLVTSGLVLTQETTMEKIYDRFRGRLMFPITNSMGKVIAFGGRALSKNQEPKYLNSPETSIYSKSNILYGFSFAKQFIKEQKMAVVVEGYMDMIAAYQAGIQCVVASSGTALTLRQIRLLQPYVERLNLAFDMDNAGQSAAQRAYELAKDFDFQIHIIQLPFGKDIAEFVQSEAKDSERFVTLAEVVGKAKAYSEYFYERLFILYGKESIAQKRKILKEFHIFFTSHKSRIEKDNFIRRLALDLQLTENQIYDEFKNFKLPLHHPARSPESDDFKAQIRKYRSDELLLGFLIEFPEFFGRFRVFLEEGFFEDDRKAIYKAFSDYYNVQGLEKMKGFVSSLAQEIQEKAALLSFYINQKYGDISEQVREKEIEMLICHLKKNTLNHKRKEIQQRLNQAANSEERGQLLQEKIKIDEEIFKLDKAKERVSLH